MERTLPVRSAVRISRVACDLSISRGARFEGAHVPRDWPRRRSRGGCWPAIGPDGSWPERSPSVGRASWQRRLATVRGLLALVDCGEICRRSDRQLRLSSPVSRIACGWIDRPARLLSSSSAREWRATMLGLSPAVRKSDNARARDWSSDRWKNARRTAAALRIRDWFALCHVRPDVRRRNDRPLKDPEVTRGVNLSRDYGRLPAFHAMRLVGRLYSVDWRTPRGSRDSRKRQFSEF